MPYDSQNLFAPADLYPNDWIPLSSSAWPSTAPPTLPQPNPANPSVSDRPSARANPFPASWPLSITLVPVDHDPFDENQPVTPPDPSPAPSSGARSYTLVPVDHDPFAEAHAPFHHDPFNDLWAAGTSADRYAFGTLPQLGLGPTDVPAGQWPQINSVPGSMVPSAADPGSALGQSVAGWPSPGPLGWPSPTQSSFAPLVPWQSPFGAGESPWPTSSGAPPPDSSAVPAPPTRSVLFNGPPAPWELRAPTSDWGSPDQTAKLFGSELPLSKSGVPTASPYPQLSISRQQWLDTAHLVTPNIVDYFTKPVPPPPPFPSTPGKIPSGANPYAPGALFEAATLLPLLEGGLLAPLARGAAGIAAEAAPRSIARIAGGAGKPITKVIGAAADAAPIEPGSFSIIDWSGYPQNLSRPKGPFRLLEGDEYEASRTAANSINRKLRRANRPAYSGMEIHEIHPVKFGGHPTDMANKVTVPIADHRALNGWWERTKWNVLRGNQNDD